MDPQTLIASLDFARARLLGTLAAIEKSGQDIQRVLAWRPGPGRAHIAWQLMHCAATHHRNLYALFLGGAVKDEALVANYAGGSTPSDMGIPSVESIRQTLEKSFSEYKAYIAGLSSNDLTTRKIGAPGKERILGDSIILYTWHEAHHQGQIHLTWNLFKAAHGIA